MCTVLPPFHRGSIDRELRGRGEVFYVAFVDVGEGNPIAMARFCTVRRLVVTESSVDLYLWEGYALVFDIVVLKHLARYSRNS